MTDRKVFVNCPQCERTVSPYAFSCPQCGHPLRTFQGFEWKTQRTINGWPLVHIAFGRDKKTGRFLVAKGIVAVGQFGVGLFTVAQFGLGLLFGFGQLILGASGVAQIALTFFFGVGQLAAGQTAIGQLAFGKFVLAQLGFGQHVWSVKAQDPVAVEYFRQLWFSVQNFFGLG